MSFSFSGSLGKNGDDTYLFHCIDICWPLLFKQSNWDMAIDNVWKKQLWPLWSLSFYNSFEDLPYSFVYKIEVFPFKAAQKSRSIIKMDVDFWRLFWIGKTHLTTQLRMPVEIFGVIQVEGYSVLALS